MKVSIKYENTTLDGTEQLFTIEFDGVNMHTYNEFMDEDAQKEVIEMFRSTANGLEGKMWDNIEGCLTDEGMADYLADCLCDIVGEACDNPDAYSIKLTAERAVEFYRENTRKLHGE